MKFMNLEILPFVVILAIVPGILSSERVRLENLKALTLYDGRLTTARRSSPVPQLKCVGGSAGCSGFRPKVVQCINMGSDGYDVQWECKADMSSKYRFGRIQVNCEGYDSPHDKDVLRGSCGLEYELDLTSENRRRKKSSGVFNPGKESVFGGMFGVAGFVLLIVLVYCCCLRGEAHATEPGHDRGYPSTAPPPYPGTGPGYPGGFVDPNAPPPPGFRPEYSPPPGYCDDDCGPRYRASAPPDPGQSSSSGFWTGAALGGLTGYLFGSSGNTDRHHYSYRERNIYPDISGFRDSDYRESRHRDSDSDRDDSRVTSGFGGTTRR